MSIMNKEKIIILLLVIVVAIGSYVVYDQNLDMRRLERIIKSNEIIANNVDSLSSAGSPSDAKSRFSTGEQLAGFFESSIRSIEGTTISIKADSIKILARIVDTEKLASFANIPDAKSLPFMEKIYTIKLPAGFDTKTLQINNYVSVSSEEVIYGTSELIASAVNVLRISE